MPPGPLCGSRSPQDLECALVPIAGRARSHRGFVVRPESRRRRESPVGAGSTRDGGGMLAAGSGICSAREVPHRGQSPLPQGFVTQPGSRRRPGSSVGAGSTRDDGGVFAAGSGICGAREVPIAGRARSHRGFVVRPESRRRRGSLVGAGSTRDGGSMLTAESGMCIGRKGPIAGRARSHRDLWCGLDRVAAADLLWERVLPAMAAACSPQDLEYAAPERSLSRAEPAPTKI